MEIIFAVAGLGIAGLALLLQSKLPLPSAADSKKAEDKLKTDPTDPDANTTVGKYLAFVLGDYEGGLPYLSRSSNVTLKTLAEHEIAPLYTDTPPKKIGMGDEWVVAAKNFKPLYRIFYDRASQWYGAAWPTLDGVWKDKVRERLKKLLLLPTPGIVKKGLPANWTQGFETKVFIDSTIAHGGGKSFRIDMDRKDPTGAIWLQSPFLALPQGPIVFSGWSASDGTDSANDRLVLNFYDGAGKFIGRAEPFLQADSPFWHKTEVKIDAPKDAVRFSVALELRSTKGSLWVDDISVRSDNKELFENGTFEK